MFSRRSHYSNTSRIWDCLRQKRRLNRSLVGHRNAICAKISTINFSSSKYLSIRFLIPTLGINGLFLSAIIDLSLEFGFGILSCITFIDVLRKLMSSIVKGSRWVVVNETYSCSMIGFNFFLAFSDNCLLSFNMSF